MPGSHVIYAKNIEVHHSVNITMIQREMWLLLRDRKVGE